VAPTQNVGVTFFVQQMLLGDNAQIFRENKKIKEKVEKNLKM
jgi:hypothetical protein